MHLKPCTAESNREKSEADSDNESLWIYIHKRFLADYHSLNGVEHDVNTSEPVYTS